MAKESTKRRQFKIKLKQKKRLKIKKLRERYKVAKTKEEREKIIEKALRVNPNLTKEDFLTPISSH